MNRPVREASHLQPHGQAVEDRRAIDRSVSPRSPWLGLIGAILVLALLAAVAVQVRQSMVLRHAIHPGDDLALLDAHHIEIDYLRLRRHWEAASDANATFDRDALRMAYESWLARVDRLGAAGTRELLGNDGVYVASMRSAERFAMLADRALGPRPVADLDRTFLVGLLPALQAVEAPMRQATTRAAERVAERAAARSATLQQHNQVGLGLTVFLSLSTLAVALVAWQQVSQLRERRRTLEELASSLRQARREAEAASESKSAFLANMSHEIRTPFHGLMGMLSILRETGLTPRQVDFLRTATESADHLLALLNDILDMSQLETGRLTINAAPIDVRALLHEVEALMRPQANAKSLALHIDADPGVPERIVADATRVKQILFNMLSNAIKFSDHGAVVLDVRVHGGGQGGVMGSAGGDSTPATLAFVVSDHGIGIDEATRGQLFRRFVQGDSSRARRHGGTGLGLEISRNLARLMDGDVTVHSKPGEGSAFTFTMPLLPGPGAPPEPAPRLDAVHATAHAPALRVLVAEDHPVNRQYMAALLENLGHQAHFTSNGEEAVQAAREGHYDVVLMDLHMPVLDGVGATRAIRALPDRAAATVPIVALTADALEKTHQRCLVAGMNDFLTKPVSPQKLATSLRRLFGSAAAALPVQAPPQKLLAPAHVGSQPVIDDAALQMALQAMSAERLASLIESFLDQSPQTVQRLRAAVRDAQPLELRVNAHAAKGAALNLGLSALAATASALHEGASHLPAHEIARLVQRYEDLVPLTREAVRAAGLMPKGQAADVGH